MDTLFNYLHFPLTFWRRKHNEPGSLLPLLAFGYIEHKESWVRRSFETVNFSLILRGGGTYVHGGRKWSVKSPCVIMQMPDDFVEYGPDGNDGFWTELFFIYPKTLVPLLRKSGLLPSRGLVWDIKNPTGVRLMAEELAMRGEENQSAPRIDRIVERLILETRLRPTPKAIEQEVIKNTLEDIRQNWRTPPDMERIAQKNNISAATLKRRWASSIGVPPAKYAMSIRIGEACRQLVETSRSVAEIARDCGFEDEFYFSRAFRRIQGIPPREYRKAARRHSSGSSAPRQ
jgi:AraC-like DNA-binding protein